MAAVAAEGCAVAAAAAGASVVTLGDAVAAAGHSGRRGASSPSAEGWEEAVVEDGAVELLDCWPRKAAHRQPKSCSQRVCSALTPMPSSLPTT